MSRQIFYRKLKVTWLILSADQFIFNTSTWARAFWSFSSMLEFQVWFEVCLKRFCAFLKFQVYFKSQVCLKSQVRFQVYLRCVWSILELKSVPFWIWSLLESRILRLTAFYWNKHYQTNSYFKYELKRTWSMNLARNH